MVGKSSVVEDPSDAPTVVSKPSDAATVVGAAAGTARGAGRPGPPTRLKPGDRLGERYEIEALLGEGGFGAVYRARDRVLNRTVAIKLVLPDMASDPEMMERFKREVLLASKISHRNVVRIHDLGEVGELKFVSMAFIDGTDLRAVIDEEKRLGVEKALRLFRQVCTALQAAHEAGVVHRDLKPHNILIDKEGNAYIADFGISRPMDRGATMTEAGMIIGTAAYMSPEQARGETPDQRSDIYSLGLILYEMLTGDVPFRAPNSLSMLMKRVHEDPRPPIELRPDLPHWISRVVERALQRDTADRYQSVSEMLADLDQEQATRVWRRKTRGRLVWVAAGVGLLAALVLAGTLWLKRKPAELPAGPRAALVLLPFRNATNNPEYDWTRTGIPDLLRSELRESEQLSLVGEDRVREIVEGMKLDLGDELQPATLQRISYLIGVDNLLKADLFKLGEQFRIEASLLNVGASSIASDVQLRVEGRGEDSLFEMVEELGRGVRRELGLSRRRRSSGKPSTESVEALRLYSEGAALAQSGSDLEAAEKLKTALNVDPRFAAASALLAETYQNLGRDQEALDAAEQAAAELSRVSPVEAARIRAVRARLSGQPEAALAAYEEWCALAPNEPAAFLALATFQEDSGDLEGALTSMLKVVDLDPKNANAHYALGRIRVRSGDMTAGLSELNEALRLHVETGNEEGRATVLNGLGNTYSYLGDYDNAMRQYRESLAVREAIGDLRGVGVALDNISQLLHDTGHYQEAVENQQRCLRVYEELGDREGLALAYETLGDIYSRSGRPEEALQAFQQSLTILRDVGDVYALADTLRNMGYIYTLLGQYNEAFFFLSDAQEKHRAAGEQSELLRSLIYLGILEQIQGRFDRALRYYAEGMSLAREIQNTERESIISANLANIHYDQGDYAAALALLDEVEADSRESDNVYLLADCLTYQAELRQALGDFPGAEAALDEAGELSKTRDSRALVAEILIRRGELLLAQGRRNEAATVLGDALDAATDSKDHRLQLVARLRSAQARRSVRDLQEVAQEAGKTGLAPVAARARLALAQRLLEQGELSRAADEAEVLIEEATPLTMRDTLFEAHTLCITAFDRQGRQDRAAEHASTAMDLLQEMRKGLEGDALATFVVRPETARFATEAQRVLEARGQTEAAARLETLLTPTP